MAKKSYKAIHKILLSAGKGRSGKAEYAEPGSFFQMEEADGAKLVKLGAAKLSEAPAAAQKAAAATTKPKAGKKAEAAAAPAPEPEGDDGAGEGDGEEDLV
jgi:hypothetical protein